MIDTRRTQFLDIIRRELVGPDPIDYPGKRQPNGEEILTGDPPGTRYIAGILYPQQTRANLEFAAEDITDSDEAEDIGDFDLPEADPNANNESLEYGEDPIDLSNANKPSAISMTVAISADDQITLHAEGAWYHVEQTKDPETGKRHDQYCRIPLLWDMDDVILPNDNDRIKSWVVEEGHLALVAVWRYRLNNFDIFTFTLENQITSNTGTNNDANCFFQSGFSIRSQKGFCQLPDAQKFSNDQDYHSNRLLYRHVRDFAQGHGCAAEWVEDGGYVYSIHTATIPVNDVKPIVPSTLEKAVLGMYDLSDHGAFDKAMVGLEAMCKQYELWIEKLEAEEVGASYVETAKRHIDACRNCLLRMKHGIELLRTTEIIRKAFRLMNRAMLMQQLHYKLPLRKWMEGSDHQLYLNDDIKIPDIDQRDTWFNQENEVYGKWRPFQLAFVLMNLESMAEPECDERKIVDLIWFPTGGGKTEAYLGLSAYTIFLRRLKDPLNAGTSILMRYTLRLLTSQQYERAAAMICACDVIRAESPNELGNKPISIGLWVGKASSPNHRTDAVEAFNKLSTGSERNPFVVLKCPWCGAEMGPVKFREGDVHLRGYHKDRITSNGKQQVCFRCDNPDCNFSKRNLPMHVVDDDIYETPPTLLLGTVDKFAMLPWTPAARAIFAIQADHHTSPPELIIQDELHLISGPLGSMVGHYETMILELCTFKRNGVTQTPKIIASTATISNAKQQCNALYACEMKNVHQFPPPGLDARDSFFAYEDSKSSGRIYAGVLAPGASDATTFIRLNAALLYAGKAIQVETEAARDPYWTNMVYFNSLRELGQASFWFSQDIDEYLNIICKRRYEDKDPDYRNKRRYQHRKEELNSNVPGEKVPQILQALGIKYHNDEKINPSIDVCLATNIISVGLDIPRLGLMTVTGQPKTTSEYIQATSRVGRSKSSPGLVFTLFRPGRPRDKSHYEHFQNYHSRMYCNVEPTSVTPFSAPLRDRALHALLIGLYRLKMQPEENCDQPVPPDDQTLSTIRAIILKRVMAIDPAEADATMKRLDWILKKWTREQPSIYQDFNSGEILPLMFPSGKTRNQKWGLNRGFETPMSMRNVDTSSALFLLENGYLADEEDEEL